MGEEFPFVSGTPPAPPVLPRAGPAGSTGRVGRTLRAAAGHRAVRVAATAVGVAALLAATVEVALRVSPAWILDALPRVSAPRGVAVSTLAPVREAYLRELLGEHGYRALLGLPLEAPKGGAAPSGPGGPSPPSAGGGGAGEGTGRAPATLKPGPLGPVATPGGWILTVEARSDRPRARRGEVVTYLFVVTNVGHDEFRGLVRLDYHIPAGTTDANPGTCHVQELEGVDPDRVCGQVFVPVPGAPTDQVHQGGSETIGRIPPGGRLVIEHRVRVAEAVPPGTELPNHAHMNVHGDLAPHVTSNEVVVVVE